MEVRDKTPSIYQAYTRMHKFTYRHAHARKHALTNTRTHTHTHTHTYTHSHIHTHLAAHSYPLSTPPIKHQSTALQGRLAYRRAIVQRLIPALRAFSPGLILISAGFDGAQG